MFRCVALSFLVLNAAACAGRGDSPRTSNEDGPAEWGVRVRVVGGEAVTILPSTVCEPGRLPTTGRRPHPYGTAFEVQEARQALGRRIELEVSLDRMGTVTDVRVTQSSRSRLMDRDALDRALWIRYQPSLHDEIGVPSTLPGHLQRQARTTPRAHPAHA
jgi:TonB family protein